MKPAKSIAILSLLTLLISVILPLSAFAASEVQVSITQNRSESTNAAIHENKASLSAEIDAKFDREKERIIRREEVLRQEIEKNTGNEKSDNSASEKITAESEVLRPTRRTSSTPPPTEKPSSTPTPKRTRITTRQKATPTQTQKQSPVPTQSPTPSQTVTINEKQEFIMNAINTYRKSRGLPEVITDPYTCTFAKTRAEEIRTSFNHDGFRNRINADTLPYPDYNQVTENIAMTSDYKKVVTLWINSPGHAENMRRDTPFVCVESSGNFYAYEGWRP